MISKQPVRDLAATEAASAESGVVASNGHAHLVGLYESDEFLADSVADFLAPAFAAAEPMVIVATPLHVDQIVSALENSGLDVSSAREDGRLVTADAAETMARFMGDSGPDRDRFREAIGGLFDDVVGDGPVRAFGEMVALLWANGDISGAIAVEDLWNELAEDRSFALFCAYPIAAFEHEKHTEAFQTICRQHSAVLPTESYANLADPDDRLRVVALLQQEATAGLNERTALRRKQEELEAALDELRELDRLRNEFVAMVVHDIRSPVAIISGFLGVLRDNWPELDAEQITEYLETTIESADQVERLVDDILTMSRIDSGEFTFDMRPTDLRRIVDRAAGQVRAATNRQIDVASPSNLRPALVDEDRQIQILTNLLSNAAKFSPDDTPITVSLVDRGDQLLVSVRDEGVGVDAAEQERLFRPFSRLDGQGRGNNGGTGLGLYISKALVEGQGGSIWVDSARGAGATFSYTVVAATTRS